MATWCSITGRASLYGQPGQISRSNQRTALGSFYSAQASSFKLRTGSSKCKRTATWFYSASRTPWWAAPSGTVTPRGPEPRATQIFRPTETSSSTTNWRNPCGLRELPEPAEANCGSRAMAISWCTTEPACLSGTAIRIFRVSLFYKPGSFSCPLGNLSRTRADAWRCNPIATWCSTT